jgi:hypothetical protein
MWAKLLSSASATNPDLINLDKVHKVVANQVGATDWRPQVYLDLSVLQSGESGSFVTVTSYASQADAEAAGVALLQGNNVRES